MMPAQQHLQDRLDETLHELTRHLQDKFEALRDDVEEVFRFPAIADQRDLDRLAELLRRRFGDALGPEPSRYAIVAREIFNAFAPGKEVG